MVKDLIFWLIESLGEILFLAVKIIEGYHLNIAGMELR